ncbi:TPA: hypothetical protein HA317_04340, partial [Candidatus Woesearchaeota archaeon]|nr:hypothetical protein [Candidatus Woesearchaeota archaeon]
MKKEALLVCALLILLGLTASVSADAIEEEIDSIVYYAEQYELGKINYLQLVVYENTIREEINSQLGQEYVVEGDWLHRGLTQEDVKRLFGQPTEMTNWVWVINEEHDERIDEKLPRWEKRLFDGRKIIITFNAWPQIIKREDEIIKFYEVDFRIRFKTHYEFNIDDMLKEIEYLGDQYVENKQNGEELVKKAVEYGRFLQAYLEQNNDDCKSVMNDFFDAGDKRAQQKKARFRVHAYEGENLLLRINVEACESCEWPHVNMWFDIDVFGRGFKQKDQKQALEKDIHKSFEELSTEELNAELEKAIKELVLLIREGDKAGRFINPEKIAYYRTALERINRFLDERYYEDKWLREENYAKRLAFLTDLLGRYGDVEKEAITEIRYENRLVEKFEEVTHKYCRHIGAFSCDLDEGCKEGECIAAKGGLEDCHNNIDDDGDGITDCPDPDCAVECGWICKDVCQEECWPCNERECTSVCKECWECKGDCEDVCRDTCWKCQKEKCESQPVCENCQRCQRNAWDEYEEEKCKRICNACEDCADCENCQNGLKYRECRDVCEDTCWECKREKCHDLNVCKMCWDCQERGGDCKSTCDGCWECEKENCYENPICSECKDCEKGVSREIDKERCDKRCKTCDECKEEKGEKACSGEKECRECKDCRAEEKRHLCDDVCGDECWPCNEERCGNQCKT